MVVHEREHQIWPATSCVERCAAFHYDNVPCRGGCESYVFSLENYKQFDVVEGLDDV